MLDPKEKGEKGAKYLLMAHHFLWVYPKNAELLASRFGVCSKLASGKSLMRWLTRIVALRASKIVWPDAFEENNSEVFLITVDTTDFKTWEKKHPRFNIDRSYYSKKHNHGGLKYEIGVSVFRDKIVWAKGPFKATQNDLTIWRYAKGGELLRNKVPMGKYTIADLGYRMQEGVHEVAIIAHPNSKDALPLKKFKSLARCRTEDVNGRIKNYGSMFQEFTHSTNVHEACFYAVLVTVQYCLDVGNSFLFKV